MMVNGIGAADEKKTRVTTCLRPMVWWGWGNGCCGFVIALGAIFAAERGAWSRRRGTI
jgi:hypothetical protein